MKGILSNRSLTKILCVGLLALACQTPQQDQVVSDAPVANQAKQKVFEMVPSSHTNIHMINLIEETKTHNFFMDGAYYNGGGVSLGDVNNDGIVDVNDLLIVIDHWGTCA